MFNFLQLIGILASAGIGLAVFGIGPAVVWLKVQNYEFLLNDSILIPALVGTLILVAGGLFGNFRRHAYNRPLVLGVLGCLAIIAGLWVSKLLALAGYFLIIWTFFEDYHILIQYLTIPSNKPKPSE